MKKTPVLGIDLGTTNSLVAYVEDGRPRVIGGPGGNLLPSAVTFLPDGKVVVGQAARDLRLVHPERTVLSIKRVIGKSFQEVENWLSHIPYPIVDVDQKRLAVQVGEERRTPEEISALILTAVRERAEAHFGVPVRDAVITVPAYFDDTQRHATRDAGKIAGLRVLRILNEPTAAALAYGLHEKKEGAIAVYDLGGGTFDISVLMVTDGVFRVLSTHGDTFLGGDDMDELLFRHVAERMKIDLKAERSSALLQALRKEAERVKIALTEASEAIFALEWNGKKLAITIPRSEFENLIRPIVERTFSIVRKALHDAVVAPSEIDEVVLVGGSTRVPLVREMAASFFGRRPHTELNPDEVVALGAAVQADILGGGTRDVMLLDVIPLSLGMETMGGAVAKLIDRNTTVPAEATQKFTTYADNQTAVDFTIVQGERELVQDNRLLGRFKLRGIPPMPAGLPVIQVTFSVDESGILTVTAIEERSGQKTRVEVVPAHGLLQEEVDQIIDDAYDHAEDDYRNRMLAEIRVEGEQILHATERALGAAGTLASPDERTGIGAAMAQLRHVMGETEFRAIKNAYDRLNDVSRDLAERMMNKAVGEALRDKRLDDMDS